MTGDLPTPTDGWDSLTDPERRPELIRRLREGVPETWGLALHDAIVSDVGAEGSELAAVLAVAGSVAPRLAPEHRRGIFERCAQLLRAPVDPYDRHGTLVAGAARTAAAELLAADPAVDDEAIRAARDGGGDALLPAIASALRAGRDPFAKRFVRYVEALSLSSEQLIRFAEDCTADNSPIQVPAGAAIPELPRRRRLTIGVRGTATGVAAFLTGPAIAVVLALIGSCVDGRLTAVSADAGVAIGALAVLAAVHVLSVQLAATSLPTPIATAAVAPASIKVGYGMAIAALATAMLAKVEDPPLNWHPGAVAAVLVVLTMALIAVVTITTLRELGVAAVSVRAARRGEVTALRASEVVEDLRRQTRAFTDALDGHAYLRRQLSPDETAERRPLYAETSGVLNVDSSVLTELSRRRAWRDGDLRLDILHGPGAGVAAGSELASVVAPANVVIDDAEHMAAAQAFEVSAEPRLRALNTLGVALVDEMLVLARSGDSTGARAVQSELLALLVLHLAAIRNSDGAGTPPPAILAVTTRALRTLAEGMADEASAHCAELLEGILWHATVGGGVITAIATRAVGDRPVSLDQLAVLYTAGQRAIQLESDAELRLVQETIHRLVRDASEPARFAHETAGRLVQYAAIVDPVMSRRVWGRYRDGTASAPMMDQVRCICRIGAVALRVGNLSLAVECALALPADVDLVALRDRWREADDASRENFLSEIGGQLLGTDAESRLVRFTEVAGVLRPS